MKKSSLILLFTFVALALLTPAGIQAANPSPTPKATPHIYTTIESVDANSITIKGPKATSTYKITPQTEITFKGETVAVTDLKPGMRVSVTAGTDATEAERIAAEDPPKAAPKK
jgi:hypothetical protein